MVSTPLVLIADDDEVNRFLLREWLGMRYRIVEAASGPGALAVAADAEVDLVICDVMMPELDGLEVCRRIKLAHPDDFLPVLLLTALDEPEDREAASRAGADGFLSKPASRRELISRVGALLRTRELHLRLRAAQARHGALRAAAGELLDLLPTELAASAPARLVRELVDAR